MESIRSGFVPGAQQRGGYHSICGNRCSPLRGGWEANLESATPPDRMIYPERVIIPNTSPKDESKSTQRPLVRSTKFQVNGTVTALRKPSSPGDATFFPKSHIRFSASNQPPAIARVRTLSVRKPTPRCHPVAFPDRPIAPSRRNHQPFAPRSPPGATTDESPLHHVRPRNHRHASQRALPGEQRYPRAIADGRLLAVSQSTFWYL